MLTLFNSFSAKWQYMKIKHDSFFKFFWNSCGFIFMIRFNMIVIYTTYNFAIFHSIYQSAKVSTHNIFCHSPNFLTVILCSSCWQSSTKLKGTLCATIFGCTVVPHYNKVHLLWHSFADFFVCNFACFFFTAHYVLHPDWL